MSACLALLDRRLEVLSLEGAGGHGEVYRARLGLLEGPGERQTVALKVLRPASLVGEGLARLREEGRLLARLHDPAIVGLVGMVQLDGVPALLLEYVDGEDLSEVLGHGHGEALARALPPRTVAALGQQVAGALRRVGAARSGAAGGLVHRDIKPANLRLTRTGGVKVLDFGVAKALGQGRAGGELTGAAPVGTLSYLAPEWGLEGEVGPACDVYALGVVLLEALSGARLFPGATIQQRMAVLRDATDHDRRVAELCQRCPAGARSLSALLQRMVCTDPQPRPVAAEVEEALERLAPELEGPSLEAWARGRPLPERPVAPGRLVGRHWHLRAPTAPSAASASFSLTMSAFSEVGPVEVEEQPIEAVPIAPPVLPPSAPPWRAALALPALVVAAVGLAWLWVGSGPVQGPVPVAPPGPAPAAVVPVPPPIPEPAESAVEVEPTQPRPAPSVAREPQKVAPPVARPRRDPEVKEAEKTPPAEVHVTLHTLPRELEVRWQGEVICPRTSCTDVLLPVGRHELELRKRGPGGEVVETWHDAVTVSHEGQAVEIRRRL